MLVNSVSNVYFHPNYVQKNKNNLQTKQHTYVNIPQRSKGLPNISYNYFVSFGQKEKDYNPDNDTQLQNIRKEYKDGDIREFHTENEKEKELITSFFKDKSNKKIEIKRILGSNGTTYIVSDKNNKENKVVIKCQHKEADNPPKEMRTKCDSPDFDIEGKNLSEIPKNIHSTKLLATIETSVPNDKNFPVRKMLAISFVDGKRLTDSDIDKTDFLNQNNLKEFYKDLLELDKAGFYHRDLNAYNILASQADNNLYIIDYGSGKNFSEMQKKEDYAKQLFEDKQKRFAFLPTTVESLKQDEELLKNIKYRKFEGLEYSNLENFESLALLPYLKRHLDKLPATMPEGKFHRVLLYLKRHLGKLPATETQNGEINKIDKLFLQHLKLSADYHKERLGMDNLNLNDLKKNNEQILSNALQLVNPDNPDELSIDIAQVELLRLKMLHSQKAARLYVGNDDKNYKMALYWNMELGTISKYATYKIEELIEKYDKKNPVINKYLQLNKQIAEFYNKQIFPEVYLSVSNAALEAVTSSDKKFKSSIKGTIKDGCWLDTTKRAPSNYIPDTPHKYGKFQF